MTSIILNTEVKPVKKFNQLELIDSFLAHRLSIEPVAPINSLGEKQHCIRVIHQTLKTLHFIKKEENDMQSKALKIKMKEQLKGKKRRIRPKREGNSGSEHEAAEVNKS